MLWGCFMHHVRRILKLFYSLFIEELCYHQLSVSGYVLHVFLWYWYIINFVRVEEIPVKLILYSLLQVFSEGNDSDLSSDEGLGRK